MPKCIAFRVDASVEIGTGHLMRSLTLADGFRDAGFHCHFICRFVPDGLASLVRRRGHVIHVLTSKSSSVPDVSNEVQSSTKYVPGDEPPHIRWLGVDWKTDAAETMGFLLAISPAWLVVDHYALDARWEREACPAGTRLAAIDDLADRSHRAELLLDQNLGREVGDYVPYVTPGCRLLIGPAYALLRPEFKKMRAISLLRRQEPRLEKVLVTMGGVDKDDATGTVLDEINRAGLPKRLSVEVVLGGSAPHLDKIRRQALKMSYPVTVSVDVTDMASHMAQADLAIGAAGSTSWERCCLGLPSLILSLAANQTELSLVLDRMMIAKSLGAISDDEWGHNLSQHLRTFVDNPNLICSMIERSASLVDGDGVQRVMAEMFR